jgi:uroporphyrinogen decarboxylase
MRQAGRYLPEYRALRARYSLHDLFFTPDLIVQVTKMPIDRFGFDAAILFSDITVVYEALGCELTFDEGPNIAMAKTLSYRPEALEPIIEGIRLLRKELKVPLIGFVGAPFTIATYCIEGGAEEALAWLRRDPATFRALLDQIQEALLQFSAAQREAGVDAFQIFDSWANVLTHAEFHSFSLPYVTALVQQNNPMPTLFFMREAARYLTHIPCGISLDGTLSLPEARRLTSRPLQGDLAPDVLFKPPSVIQERVGALLSSMQGDPAFIINLAHGIKPGTPLEGIYALVESVS